MHSTIVASRSRWSSTSFRSEMSATMVSDPTTSPLSSRVGLVEIRAHKSEPSSRRKWKSRNRQVSDQCGRLASARYRR